MLALDHETRTATVKVVVVGQPGSGKAEVLNDIASQLSTSGSLASGHLPGTEIQRVTVRWSEPLVNGYTLEVRTFCITGRPAFASATQLTMREADGFLFVLNFATEDTAEARDKMQELVDAARRNNQDLGKLPFVLQYHNFEDNPQLPPEAMDEAIGIPVNSLPRFCTCRTGEDAPSTGPYLYLIRQVVERVNQQLG